MFSKGLQIVFCIKVIAGWGSQQILLMSLAGGQQISSRSRRRKTSVDAKWMQQQKQRFLQKETLLNKKNISEKETEGSALWNFWPKRIDSDQATPIRSFGNLELKKEKGVLFIFVRKVFIEMFSSHLFSGRKLRNSFFWHTFYNFKAWSLQEVFQWYFSGKFSTGNFSVVLFRIVYYRSVILETL